jgi:hypothetical protein
MKTMNWMLFSSLLLAGPVAPVAAEPSGSPEFVFYVQQAWPRQTTTNEQIAEINRTFGSDFDDWGDVPNLSIGAQLLWRVAPGWKLGVQVDYGSGSIDGREPVPTPVGPAKLSFEQRYDIYADVYAVAKWYPWPESKQVQPFVLGGAGMAYESDTTTLKLRNEFIDSGLRVENDGWFPTYTAGLGVNLPVSDTSSWYVEFGIAYVWARMTNRVPVSGDLAPSATVTADTDLSGPNFWLGIARSF